MILHLVALLLSLVSIAVTGVLIGVLSLQEAYAHMKAVKRLFIEALITFIGIDVILLVRRVSPLDEAATIIAIRLIYSLTLYAAAAMGSAATIIYRKPKSYTWRDIYTDTVRKMFLPFISFMSILLILFILGWILPLSVELRSCPTSYTDLYVPIFESRHLIIFSISFIAFLIYPTAVFLLASYAVENAAVSRDLRMFAIGVIGVAVSSYLEAFFLMRCFAEAVDIIRIPCFIAMTYVFRKATVLQSFRDVELKEYIERLHGDARKASKLMSISVLAVILILSILGTQIPLVTAAELHVGPGQPYLTIQAAINAANPGDTVIVHAGTYVENIVINKASLFLESVERRNAVIKGSIDIEANGVTLDGFEVDCDETQIAVIALKQNGITVRNILVDGGRQGILVQGESVTNQATGITIQDNRLRNTKDSGLHVNFAQAAIVSGNEIESTGLPWYMPGILAIGDKDTTIENNILNGNYHGIAVHGSGTYVAQGAIVRGNIVTNCANLGIAIASAEDVTIVFNQITDNKVGVHHCDGWWSGAGKSKDNVAHFNNIVGNSEHGVKNDAEATVNAKYNWLGHESGPSGVGPGSGDAVSINVDFTPWLTAPISGVDSETVPAGTTTIVGSSALGVSADVTTTTGTPTVTVATYASNPGGTPPFTALGKYIDERISSADGVTEIVIKVYYTDADIATPPPGIDENSLRLYWWDGSAWEQCSDSGVNTAAVNSYSGYIWAKIRSDTTPNLTQLTGTPFGGGGFLIPEFSSFALIALLGSIVAFSIYVRSNSRRRERAH